MKLFDCAQRNQRSNHWSLSYRNVKAMHVRRCLAVNIIQFQTRHPPLTIDAALTTKSCKTELTSIPSQAETFRRKTWFQLMTNYSNWQKSQVTRRSHIHWFLPVQGARLPLGSPSHSDCASQTCVSSHLTDAWSEKFKNVKLVMSQWC